MRSYISYDELEELGETIVRAYINKTRRYNALCVDIEGLVTDYLGLCANEWRYGVCIKPKGKCFGTHPGTSEPMEESIIGVSGNQ